MSEMDSNPNSELFDRLRDKDAEIAELRHRASNAELQRSLLQNQSNALLSERDEARECVKRLYPLAGAHVDQLRHDAAQPMTAGRKNKLDAELAEARAALAATPEHLRGAGNA